MSNSTSETANRKIIHIDMDAFYASVEQHDHPEWRNKPVIVGGDPKGRGVVASPSYEARKYGVKSAMSAAKAAVLCPNAIFVYPHFERYREISDRIHELFLEITPLVEPLSLDEAYLDVTENRLNEPLASKIAASLKRKIKDATGLTASAGVGPNKFIAKLASDFDKPDGLVIVPPEKVDTFVETLPVEKFWGVGPATSTRLREFGLNTAKDIRRCDLKHLRDILGSYADFIYELAHGRDSRVVDPERDPKSRGSETTFEKNITDVDLLLKALREQSREIASDLKEMGRPGRTVSLKLRYSDFQTITRSRTLPFPTANESQISSTASELLLSSTEAGARPVRLVGVSVGNLLNPDIPYQLWFELFENSFS